MGQEKPKGRVMVVGGGIAGIQAALTLADAGYVVHLVERSASLGGMVPKLHRFYPLCACCKLDPNISACEQHPNISILLDSTVERVSGDVGHFSVSVKTDSKQNEIDVGAIILAAGIETFDPTEHDIYSYGYSPNVVTSVEYEQVQKPLGPEAGTLKRPSDGKIPEKIAWLQCVGSRDINRCDASYCSSVCCMHALKEAVNTKEFNEEIETTIFYMDMRTHGKGFEHYLNTAIDREVNLIRSRVHSVTPIAESDDLAISYADENGESHKDVYDMVVLSVGLRPSGDAIKLAEKIGVDLTKDSFVGTIPFKPVSTNKPGVFVCGGLAGPHDIGQSVCQANAAVSEVATVLDPEIISPDKTYPHRSGAMSQKPKILLAYHLCPSMSPYYGEELKKWAGNIPGIVAVSGVELDMLNNLTKELQDSGANRLVFTSCSPATYKKLIQEALRLSGLNPFLYETVDLRVIDPHTAPSQIRDRIRMGVARASFLSAPPLRDMKVNKRALVVGGGVSGLESALTIADEGYPVTLVEKEKILGGHGRHVRATWQGYDVQDYLKGLVSKVKANKNINVLTETTVKVSRGSAGRFETTLSKKGKSKRVLHGATILATGGDTVKPREYLYGKAKNVYLWSELSSKMIENPSSIEKAKAAVFIQCVGSREPDCPYCSNFCCSFAARTAVDLKTKNPDMDVYILYREMRTFGEREDLYRKAREMGVVFIRYDTDNKPEVKTVNGTDKLSVTVRDPILCRPIGIEADFISLQTAIKSTGNGQLAETFGIELDSDGFIAESPEKLKPTETSIHGIFMAGLAAYPKDTGESITQAKAASARALDILCKDTIQVGGHVAEVMPEKCAVCCTCVRTCPFDVPYIDPERGAAYIDPGLCQGCGICVAECPGKAIIMSTCSDQMLNEAPSLLMGTA